MDKATILREDGRYVIFYGFDRPIPAAIQEMAQSMKNGGRTKELTPGDQEVAAEGRELPSRDQADQGGQKHV